MRDTFLRGSTRALRTVCALAALLPVFACGSSSQTSVAPSSVRCAVQGLADTTAFPADGGSGTLRISTARECTWSAQSEAPWIVLTGETSGQGQGSLPFTIAPNGDPAARSAPVRVNDQRTQISQAGRPCAFQLSSTLESVPAAGAERLTVAVQASSSACTWSAAVDVPWITIIEGTGGAGSGEVVIRVAPATGPTRTGNLTIAGQRVTIQQGTGCTFATGVTTIDVSAAGGRAEVPVVAPAGCAWTATSDAPWIIILSGQSGSGAGTVVFQFQAIAGPPRTGTLTIAGQRVTVQQGSGCTYATGVTRVSVSAAGGRAEVPVVAPGGCEWAAATSAPWIAIVEGQAGSGNGTVVLQVEAVAGPARTGALTVAGVSVTIEQGSGCTYSTGVTALSATAAGGRFDIPVAAPQGCTWTAVSQIPWIEVASGSSGNGPATVSVSVAATDGPARSGTVIVAGVNVTVSQASGCRFTVEPTSYAAPGLGGSSSVTVQAGAGCQWTAATDTPWVSLSQSSGAGPAQVGFVVAANNGPQRSGTFTVAGHTVSVSQASPCTWRLVPGSESFDANGGRANVLVIVVGGCAWTAASTVDWMTMEAGHSGVGDGLVQFIVAPNLGPPRSGIVRIAGIDFTVQQAAR